MKIFLHEDANSDREALSHNDKKRSSKRSNKGENAAGQKDIENKRSIEKCEKNILHKLGKIERNEKVIITSSNRNKSFFF